MKRHFRLDDGNSSKFWEIDLDGTSHTVRFGRIGTDGQTKTKEFSSAAEAKQSADKLVQQKTKKGYQEVSAAPTSKRTSKQVKRTVEITKDDLLLRFAEHFGEEEPFDEAELEYYMEGFLRGMSAEDVEKFYEGVPFGDEIAERINAVNAVGFDARSKAPANPIPIEESDVIALVKRTMSTLSDFLGELDDQKAKLPWWARPVGSDEAADSLENLDFVTYKLGGQGVDGRDAVDLWEIVESFMVKVMSDSPNAESAAAAMFRAVEMVTFDPLVAFYVQWPIYAGQYQTKDAFKPYFEIWRHGIGLDFTGEKNLVEIWIPNYASQAIDLKQFLPPGTIQSQPLEYDWEPYLEAEVFVATEDLASMRSWWEKHFGEGYTITEQERDSALTVNFDGDAFIELRLVEADSGLKDGFHEFLASENLAAMEGLHQPKLLGVALLVPHSSTGPQSWKTYAVQYVETVDRVRSIKAESAEHAEKLVRAEVKASQTARHRVTKRRTENWNINVND